MKVLITLSVLLIKKTNKLILCEDIIAVLLESRSKHEVCRRNVEFFKFYTWPYV